MLRSSLSHSGLPAVFLWGGKRRSDIGAAVAEPPARGGILSGAAERGLGFERTYLSRVERGILNPTAIRVWTIADALNVPFRELVGRMETWAVEQGRR
jgi:hypothetical protein